MRCLIILMMMVMAQAADAQHVRIKTRDGYGSGTHIGGNWVLTASHLFENEDTVVVEFPGGTAPADYIATDSKHDVAFVRTSSPVNVPSAKIAERDPSPGESIQILGYAHAQSNPTHLAGVRDSRGWVDTIGIQGAEAKQGMSGGPAYDAQMNVIAPISCAGGDAAGTTLVSKNEHVWTLLKKVQYQYPSCYGGYCVPSSSGVIVQTTPPQTTPSGTTIVKPVSPNSPSGGKCDCQISQEQLTQITQTVTQQVIASLSGNSGLRGPQGEKGEPGPPGKTPTQSELNILIQQAYHDMKPPAEKTPVYYSITPRKVP